MSMGTGLARVWMQVQLELPVGYPCYALIVTSLQTAVIHGSHENEGHC